MAWNLEIQLDLYNYLIFTLIFLTKKVHLVSVTFLFVAEIMVVQKTKTGSKNIHRPSWLENGVITNAISHTRPWRACLTLSGKTKTFWKLISSHGLVTILATMSGTIQMNRSYSIRKTSHKLSKMLLLVKISKFSQLLVTMTPGQSMYKISRNLTKIMPSTS